jgi:hypothetical protein
LIEPAKDDKKSLHWQFPFQCFPKRALKQILKYLKVQDLPMATLLHETSMACLKTA